jgi:hypothetical protein
MATSGITEEVEQTYGVVIHGQIQRILQYSHASRQVSDEIRVFTEKTNISSCSIAYLLLSIGAYEP